MPEPDRDARGLVQIAATTIRVRMAGLSSRDRRALLALGLFAGVAAYWLFLLEPAYERWTESSRRRSTALERSLGARQRIDARASVEARRDELRQSLGRIGARIRMPPPRVGVPPIVAAVASAATSSGVQVTSIRPIVETAEDTETTSLRIVGRGGADDLVALLQLIWGLDVRELRATRDDGSGQRVQFQFDAAILSDEDYAVIQPLGTAAAMVAPAELEIDPFYPPPPPRRPLAAPRPPAPAPPPRLDMSGLRLLGVSSSGRGRIAAVRDRSASRDVLVEAGDEIRDMMVETVEDRRVTLRHGDLTAVLELPPSPSLPASGSAPPGARISPGAVDGNAAQPAPSVLERLRLRLRALTPLAAAQQGLGVSSGLLVVSAPRSSSLQRGDVIVSINREAVGTLAQAMSALKSVGGAPDTADAAQCEIRIEIYRNDEIRVVNLPRR